MKIAVAATGNSLDAPVDPRFGRCAWFVIVDSETLTFEAVENPGAEAGGGAGIQAAQVVASKGAQAVVASRMGPNAHQALTAAGAQVFSFAGGTVRDAVEAVTSGNLTAEAAPTAPMHAGMGSPAATTRIDVGGGCRGMGGTGRGLQQGFRGGRARA
jgi:predicted Fe-Mo cluster-binding NifX family protein